MILSTLVAATLAAAPAHSAAFWYQIAQNNYAVPTGGDVASLTDELIELLGSRDPELRDEIAYSTLAAWIYRYDRATLRGTMRTCERHYLAA